MIRRIKILFVLLVLLLLGTPPGRWFGALVSGVSGLWVAKLAYAAPHPVYTLLAIAAGALLGLALVLVFANILIPPRRY